MGMAAGSESGPDLRPACGLRTRRPLDMGPSNRRWRVWYRRLWRDCPADARKRSVESHRRWSAHRRWSPRRCGDREVWRGFQGRSHSRTVPILWRADRLRRRRRMAVPAGAGMRTGRMRDESQTVEDLNELATLAEGLADRLRRATARLSGTEEGSARRRRSEEHTSELQS